MDRTQEIRGGLVWDRTQEDVDYALACEHDAVYDLRYMQEDLKGAYNVSDRNRVSEAINYMADFLFESGISETNIISAISPKDNWNAYDIVKPEDNNKTLNALVVLKNFLAYICDTGDAPIPVDLNYLTYEKANGVEKILFDLYGVVLQISESWGYCGCMFASDFDPFNWQGWDEDI